MILHQDINNIEILYYVYKSSILNHIVFYNSNILYRIFNFGEIFCKKETLKRMPPKERLSIIAKNLEY